MNTFDCKIIGKIRSHYGYNYIRNKIIKAFEGDDKAIIEKVCVWFPEHLNKNKPIKKQLEMKIEDDGEEKKIQNSKEDIYFY